ncbi:FAD-dependent monooxygenase [Jatrophihabitans telluris]|uniref:FAD-dependent monooxygenase n=1 Tax=Jatrophihabitans telluris TaxID=2038343 RepID=A0ABY4QUQ5_9ACTN|nr:NAD(P)/FAD-dependent oxidoreductase [Jatrophihabitans telluris]UQX87416.1 FAD-dependent monooxygenase [Jatrophihabitans telluris]
MTAARPLHVLIAGGGLAGLATAQGLLKSGHSVEVFERDADLDRKQGYYLHFNAIGGNALRRCLPDDLYELYLQTSRQSYDRPESIVLDDQLRELSSRPHMGPPNDGPVPHTGVHRRTLRQVLSARLGDRLHSGNAVLAFSQDDDGVSVTLADGSTVRGDVLVGADGIRSAVRTQLLPDVPVIPTGIRGIGVYGRTPLTPELDDLMPDILNQGVLMAVDRKGTRLLIATFRPRQLADEAASEIAPDVRLDPVPAYVMVSCSVSPGTVVPPAAEWTAETPLLLRDSMRATVADWHPAADGLVAGMDPSSIFAIPFGYLEPAESWEPSRVTVAGDAAHGMLPTLGMGANLSLHDAALLVERLDQVGRGEAELLAAIGGYEAEMRATAYPILRLTLDHDTNFGGGALAEAEGRDGADGPSSDNAGPSQEHPA